MQVHRKGTDDAIKLRLALNEKTTEQLQQILLARDPGNTRRYSHDVKMRRAAMAVLRVRGQDTKTIPSTPMSAPVFTEADREADRALQRMLATEVATDNYTKPVKLAVRRFLDTLPLPENVGNAEYRAIHELLTELDSDDLDGNDLGVVDASLRELASWVAHLQTRLADHRAKGPGTRVFERCAEQRVCGDCGLPATVVSYRIRADFSRTAFRYSCANHTPANAIVQRQD